MRTAKSTGRRTEIPYRNPGAAPFPAFTPAPAPVRKRAAALMKTEQHCKEKIPMEKGTETAAREAAGDEDFFTFFTYRKPGGGISACRRGGIREARLSAGRGGL